MNSGVLFRERRAYNTLSSLILIIWVLLCIMYVQYMHIYIGTCHRLSNVQVKASKFHVSTLVHTHLPLRAFHPCLVDTLADHPTALQLLILPLLPSPRQTKSFSLNSSPPLTNTCVYPTITLVRVFSCLHLCFVSFCFFALLYMCRTR
jgi:hypothetical protein